MKNKSFILRLKPIFLVLFALLFSEVINAQLVNYALTSTLNSTSGIAANHPGGVFSTTGTNLSYTGSVAQTDGWDAGGFKYWATSSFSTYGYHTIKANARIYSTASTGPRDFALEYKIGAAGTWTLVQSFTVTATNTNYQISLPDICKNSSSVFVRWIQTSYTNIDGGAVESGSKSFIKTVSITGTIPVTPTQSANNITVVSVTPTTITLDCTPGNGDNRIIVMNTINSFTNPANDAIFTTDLHYNGDGINPFEQVMYSGTLSKITVQVPNATNKYYFRVFEFNNNNSLTRYYTAEDVMNPKPCALELISPLSIQNLRLTSADLRANITEPLNTFPLDDPTNAVLDRGFVWSTTSPVLETDHNTSELGTTGGTFSKNITGLPRGTTIYYRAWVTNESGTIYSTELSFSNIPIFTGAGNWEIAGYWNVNEVPGTNGSVNGSVNDSPVINGTGACLMTASHNITNLTVNAGKSIQINTGTTLNAAGSITNNAGTSGILIKSGNGVANGSLIWATGSPSGSVEMYSKAYTDGSAYPAKNRWQYFGIPVTS